MNNWKYKKLSTLCSKIGDGLHGTPEYSDDSDIYFINGNNLNSGKIEINSNTKKVSSNELESNFIPLNENSLLLSINGTIGSMAFYKNEKVMLGKSAAYLNFNSGINKFYYYYFQLDKIQKHFYNVATGSTIKNLSLKSIQDFEVPVPENGEWKKIASVLSSLDAKIKLNNRINVELESMAKTLYDYWFVQFDFPNSKGKPYKTSGGKMIWNDELKREIPEAWEVNNILKIGDLLGGGTPKTKESSYWGGEIPFFTPRDCSDSIFVLNTIEQITYSGLTSCSSKLYPKGTIFITARGTVGKINIAAVNMAMNQSCYAVQPKPNVNYYFLHQCCIDLVQYLKAKSNGSIFDAIVSNDIKLTPIVIPSLEKIDNFGKATKDIYERILNNLTENQKLTELRDWLLPMLMNGQVKVGNVQNKEELQIAVESKVVYKEVKIVEFKPKVCNSTEKAILAGHIINQTNNEDFGRVKFQKLLHLAEYHCKMDLDSNYVQKAAGPYAEELINEVESTLKRYRFYTIKKSNANNHKVYYTALTAAPELDDLFKQNFKDEEKSIDNLLSKFKKSTWEQCEIVSTLYAVWNNRLIKNLQINDSNLKQDFLNWDVNKKKYKTV